MQWERKETKKIPCRDLNWQAQIELWRHSREISSVKQLSTGEDWMSWTAECMSRHTHTRVQSANGYRGYYQVKMSREKVREETTFLLCKIIWTGCVCVWNDCCLSSCLCQVVYNTAGCISENILFFLCVGVCAHSRLVVHLPNLMCHLIQPTPEPLKSLHAATQFLSVPQSALWGLRQTIFG